ncbi:hypothetical protein OS493_013906 [Desmophyllum pertusum]|uniref:VWFA domain-containing protein n=1 Tax=Desmophyllum pertusum TaxID=174260 RepID=A0A9W9ZR26_9CNID|nr:hypothetical protein OS493_013906 [Desmophyllum pertusum]
MTHAFVIVLTGPYDKENEKDINGGYTEWSEWSNCSEPCGGGLRRRSRNCTNPKPRNNGTTCMEQNLGQTEESEQCNTQNCSPLGPTVGSVDSVGLQGSKSDPSPPKPCKEHLDIGVIIDSSNRIKPADYDKARRDVIELAERLQISPAGTHMAILLHSWEAHTWHRFSDNQSISAIRSKAYSLPHIRGGARTDRALELAAEEFFGWEDSGDRPDKPNVLLVFTDGDTNDGSKPFSHVTPPLDEAEVRRIVVDIGNGIHDQERRQIASNYRSVVRVSGYGDLYTKLEDVMKLACDQQFPGNCGNWGSYGPCGKTCGGGVQVRRRTCPNKNLHLRKQKKHCNTNLCPGQKPCEDTQENCPMRAASGDCWKTVQPSKLFYIDKKFPLWKFVQRVVGDVTLILRVKIAIPTFVPGGHKRMRIKGNAGLYFHQDAESQP